MFNALRYTEELKKAGFTPEQAETGVRLFIDAMNENFATQADVQKVDQKIDTAVQRLEAKIDTVEQRLNTRIDGVEQRLESKIETMEYKLTVKLGSIVTLAVGVTATLVHLLQH